MMKNIGGQEPKKPILHDEIALQRDMEHHYLARAAGFAADGDMDAFSWTMDISRTAGRDAEALEAIVASPCGPTVECVDDRSTAAATSNAVNFDAFPELLGFTKPNVAGITEPANLLASEEIIRQIRALPRLVTMVDHSLPVIDIIPPGTTAFKPRHDDV